MRKTLEKPSNSRIASHVLLPHASSQQMTPVSQATSPSSPEYKSPSQYTLAQYSTTPYGSSRNPLGSDSDASASLINTTSRSLDPAIPASRSPKNASFAPTSFTFTNMTKLPPTPPSSLIRCDFDFNALSNTVQTLWQAVSALQHGYSSLQVQQLERSNRLEQELTDIKSNMIVLNAQCKSAALSITAIEQTLQNHAGILPGIAELRREVDDIHEENIAKKQRIEKIGDQVSEHRIKIEKIDPLAETLTRVTETVHLKLASLEQAIGETGRRMREEVPVMIDTLRTTVAQSAQQTQEYFADRLSGMENRVTTLEESFGYTVESQHQNAPYLSASTPFTNNTTMTTYVDNMDNPSTAPDMTSFAIDPVPLADAPAFTYTVTTSPSPHSPHQEHSQYATINTAVDNITMPSSASASAFSIPTQPSLSPRARATTETPSPRSRATNELPSPRTRTGNQAASPRALRTLTSTPSTSFAPTAGTTAMNTTASTHMLTPGTASMSTLAPAPAQPLLPSPSLQPLPQYSPYMQPLPQQSPYMQPISSTITPSLSSNHLNKHHSHTTHNKPNSGISGQIAQLIAQQEQLKHSIDAFSTRCALIERSQTQVKANVTQRVAEVNSIAQDALKQARLSRDEIAHLEDQVTSLKALDNKVSAIEDRYIEYNIVLDEQSNKLNALKTDIQLQYQGEVKEIRTLLQELQQSKADISATRITQHVVQKLYFYLNKYNSYHRGLVRHIAKTLRKFGYWDDSDSNTLKEEDARWKQWRHEQFGWLPDGEGSDGGWDTANLLNKLLKVQNEAALDTLDKKKLPTKDDDLDQNPSEGKGVPFSQQKKLPVIHERTSSDTLRALGSNVRREESTWGERKTSDDMSCEHTFTTSCSCVSEYDLTRNVALSPSELRHILRASGISLDAKIPVHSGHVIGGGRGRGYAPAVAGLSHTADNVDNAEHPAGTVTSSTDTTTTTVPIDDVVGASMSSFSDLVALPQCSGCSCVSVSLLQTVLVRSLYPLYHTLRECISRNSGDFRREGDRKTSPSKVRNVEVKDGLYYDANFPEVPEPTQQNMTSTYSFKPLRTRPMTAAYVSNNRHMKPPLTSSLTPPTAPPATLRKTTPANKKGKIDLHVPETDDDIAVVGIPENVRDANSMSSPREVNSSRMQRPATAQSYRQYTANNANVTENLYTPYVSRGAKARKSETAAVTAVRDGEDHGEMTPKDESTSPKSSGNPSIIPNSYVSHPILSDTRQSLTTASQSGYNSPLSLGILASGAPLSPTDTKDTANDAPNVQFAPRVRPGTASAARQLVRLNDLSSTIISTHPSPEGSEVPPKGRITDQTAKDAKSASLSGDIAGFIDGQDVQVSDAHLSDASSVRNTKLRPSDHFFLPRDTKRSYDPKTMAASDVLVKHPPLGSSVSLTYAPSYSIEKKVATVASLERSAKKGQADLKS